jgi:hypothetical protein
VDPSRLEITHRALLDALAPSAPKAGAPQLVIKVFETSRSMEGMLRSGGSDPVVFVPGRHLGQLAIEGLARDPVATYAFVARDPTPIRLWDLNWGDTVLWLPSPFTPVRAANLLHLTPEPRAIKAVPGRFLVTVALVLEREALEALDPRWPEVAPGDLDEPQTARFLTNLRLLVQNKNTRVIVASNEYKVVVPDPPQHAQ